MSDPLCLPKIWLWKGVPKNKEGPLNGQAHSSQGGDLDSLREEARSTQVGVPEGGVGCATTATTTTRGGRLTLIGRVGRRSGDTDDSGHEVPTVTVQVKAVMWLGIEAGAAVNRGGEGGILLKSHLDNYHTIFTLIKHLLGPLHCATNSLCILSYGKGGEFWSRLSLGSNHDHQISLICSMEIKKKFLTSMGCYRDEMK